MRVIERTRRGRQTTEIYVEVSDPMRLQKKLAEGQRLRAELVRAHKALTGRR